MSAKGFVAAAQVFFFCRCGRVMSNEGENVKLFFFAPSKPSSKGNCHFLEWWLTSRESGKKVLSAD